MTAIVTTAPLPVADIPAIRRLRALTPLDDAGIEALVAAASETRTVPARRDLISEGMPIVEPVLILDGWAARVRQLVDGRRQILGFILPGDLVGYCGFDGAVAMTTIVGFTPLTVCALPSDTLSPTLRRAYAISGALDEAYLMAQITRLGRLSAYERIADFLLEMLERLSTAGMTHDDGFVMPLTQETLADTLGLTSVHVNRMLQQGRRSGDLEVSRSRVRVCHAEALTRTVGRQPTRVFLPHQPAVSATDIPR